jgi:hypothetical protein
MRYLKPEILEATLRRGKSIEQFLGRGSKPRTIAWLEVRPAQSGVTLWRAEVPDAGDTEHLDLYEFGGDEDWRLKHASTSVAEALMHAHEAQGARPERWVNQFLIQDDTETSSKRAGRRTGRRVASNKSLERTRGR